MFDARDPGSLKGNPPKVAVLLSKERLRRIKDSPEPRFTRRLSDQITASFNEACRIGNLGAAEHLMQALECEVARSIIVAGVDDRYNGDGLSAVRARYAREVTKWEQDLLLKAGA